MASAVRSLRTWSRVGSSGRGIRFMRRVSCRLVRRRSTGSRMRITRRRLRRGWRSTRGRCGSIADHAEPATFANTVVAMERTGELLDRVGAAFGVMAGAYTNSGD